MKPTRRYRTHPERMLIGMLSFCIVFGLVGLLGSYCTGSYLFNYRYGRLEGQYSVLTGFAIESTRLLLGIICATLGLIPGFRVFVLGLFGFRRLNTHRRVFFAVCLVFFMVLSTGLAVFEASKVFGINEGSYPYKTMQWAWEKGILRTIDIQEYYGDVSNAYRWYSMYALVFYAIIVPLIATVSLGACSLDLYWLINHYRKIVRSNATQIEVRVRRFRRILSKGGAKYVDLLGAIAVFHIYEVLIGRLTLSDDARGASAFALLLCSASGAVLFVIWIAYYSARVMAYEKLETGKLDEKGLGDANLLLRDTVLRRLGGYAVLLAFVISAPLDRIFRPVFDAVF